MEVLPQERTIASAREKPRKRLATRDWYDRLKTRDGRKEIYKIAKARWKGKQDYEGARGVKNENGNIERRPEAVNARWKQYFKRLLNVENDRDELDQQEATKGLMLEPSWSEVKEAVNAMDCGKACGPSEVVVEMLKALDDQGVSMIHKLILQIWREEEIPEKWTTSVTVPIYERKGDVLECGNYRGIKLMEHALKIMERVVDKKLREIVQVDERQFGFVKRKGTIDAIWIIRQLQEKMLERQKTATTRSLTSRKRMIEYQEMWYSGALEVEESPRSWFESSQKCTKGQESGRSMV